MEEKTKSLYQNRDPLGVLLRNWRIQAVRPHLTNGALVDLACGDNYLVKTLGTGTGVDITDYGNVDLVLENFYNLPFESGSVHNITILAAFNYFDDPVRVLTEIERIMHNDGVLIITQLLKPISNFWHKLRDTSLPRIAYSKKELQQIVDHTNLQIVEDSYFMLGLNRIYILRKRA